MQTNDLVMDRKLRVIIQLELIDRITAHLLKQNAKSQITLLNGADVSIKCRYRNGSGLKCAVGVLINDDAYTPDCEEALAFPAVSDSKSQSLLRCLSKSGVDTTHELTMIMLRQAQNIHDMHEINDWAYDLRSLRYQVKHGKYA